MNDNISEWESFLWGKCELRQPEGAPASTRLQSDRQSTTREPWSRGASGTAEQRKPTSGERRRSRWSIQVMTRPPT